MANVVTYEGYKFIPTEEGWRIRNKEGREACIVSLKTRFCTVAEPECEPEDLLSWVVDGCPEDNLICPDRIGTWKLIWARVDTFPKGNEFQRQYGSSSRDAFKQAEEIWNRNGTKALMPMRGNKKWV